MKKVKIGRLFNLIYLCIIAPLAIIVALNCVGMINRYNYGQSMVGNVFVIDNVAYEHKKTAVGNGEEVLYYPMSAKKSEGLKIGNFLDTMPKEIKQLSKENQIQKGIVKVDGKTLTINGNVVSEGNIIGVKTQKSGLIIGIINFFGTTTANIVSLVILAILAGTSFVKIEPKTEEELAEKERKKAEKARLKAERDEEARLRKIEKDKQLEEERAEREIREAKEREEREKRLNEDKAEREIREAKEREEKEKRLQEEKAAREIREVNKQKEKEEREKRLQEERAEREAREAKEREEKEKRRQEERAEREAREAQEREEREKRLKEDRAEREIREAKEREEKEKRLQEEKAAREIREANNQKEKEERALAAMILAQERAKEKERIAQEQNEAKILSNQEKAERARIADEEKAERTRIAEEEKAERARLAEEERAEKARLAEEERAERARIAEEERAEKARIAEEERQERERKIQEDKMKAAAILAANSAKSYDESDFADELEDTDDDDDYVPEKDEMKITSVDKNSGKVILIRYNKSYLAKLIQSTNDVKSYYSEIKNHILSYDKVSNRLSWTYDSYNNKGKQLVKLNIRGKTLCAYLALNPADYDYNKYYQTDISDVKKYAKVPMKIKIKSDRGLKYAIELVDEVMKLNGIEFAEEQTEDYVAKHPYQPIEELIEEKLVKELISEETMEAARLAMEYMRDDDDIKIVSVETASKLMTDEVAKEFIEKSDTLTSLGGKLGEINVEVINGAFEDGDTVTIESLHKKGLLPMKVGRVKVLARGVLNKKLTVVAEDFSYGAVKMIVLAGGKAVVRTVARKNNPQN